MTSSSTPMHDPPIGAGPRLPYEGLPARLREVVAAWLGAPVVRAESQSGGFSPGPAVRVLGANGARLFVKAVGAEINPDSPRMHRREARVAAVLPEGLPVSRLRHVHDEGPDGWIMLAFDDVVGRQPALPWVAAELEQVVAALVHLSAQLTPPPAALADVVGSVARWGVVATPWWAQLVDAPTPGADAWSVRHAPQLDEVAAQAPALLRAGPQTLLHGDLRADNVLLTDAGVVIVDWPHARVGPAWLDLACAAPSVQMQGGPEPEALLARHPAALAANPAAITAAVAAIAGYFTLQALQPPPPALPTLRPFQAAQGVVARAWLAKRMGLEAPAAWS